MADGYTDHDVQIVAHAIEWEYGSCRHEGETYTDCNEHRAHAVLAALAGAGRLLPEDTRHCPTCGPTPTEPDPRREGFRCANCKERVGPTRHLQAIRQERDRARAQLAEAQGAIHRLHQEHDGRCTECVEWRDCAANGGLGDVCTHGNKPWPCPTIVAVSQAGVGPWVPVPGPVVGAGMDLAGTPTAGAQTYATDTQTGPAGVPEEKTR